MKQLQRFRKGDWVFGYIPKGYDNHKHLIMFNVEEITRTNIETSCRYAMVVEKIWDNSDNTGKEVDEVYWEPQESAQSYCKKDIKRDNYVFFRLTEDEAMMLLVQDI